MSKLERINTFIQVIEEKGFAAAARKQGVSTAAISRQVTGLETELGVQLLQRSTRQLKLTELGRQYYESCKKMLTALHQAEDVLINSKKEATGVLHIASNRYFAITHIIPRLAEFMADNPKLRIKLELGERFPDLAKEGIDLLFGVSLEGPPDLTRKRVTTTRYVLCASPLYLQKHGTPTTPGDLSKHHYIAHSMRKPLDILTFKNEQEIFLDPILWLNDTRAMLECVLQGIGIVKLQDYAVRDALQDGRLQEVLPDFQSPPYPVYLYYQQNRHLQPKIRRFIDFYLG